MRIITNLLVLNMRPARSPFFRFALFSILLLIQIPVYAQVRNPVSIPIYRSKQDSIKIFEFDRAAAERRNSKHPDIKKSDSLVSLWRKLRREGIIGYRKVYSPAADHISLDSLLKIQDYSLVKKISISHYPSSDFPEVVLQCKNLESLELLGTQISVLPKSLNALPNLRVINVYHHRSTRKLRLRKNNTVTALRIRGSNPKKLPRSYRPFTALTTLDLTENSLTRFPNGARHNKNLQEINLQENQLTLTKRLKRHRYLERLALQHNRIAHVPAAIRRFTNLRKLTFNYNEITTAHASIKLLDKLEQLSFYHNQLSAIPPAVYEISSLREIDLFYNQIETIEPAVRQWTNLKMLYLSDNKILSLPEEIGALPALEGLYVWDNRISSLPETLGNIKTLRFLWVNNNNLQQLPASIFGLDKIEELDVSHNFLTEIPEAVFDYPYLKILSLVDNPWNKETMQYIPRRARELRGKNVFVHITENP